MLHGAYDCTGNAWTSDAPAGLNWNFTRPPVRMGHLLPKMQMDMISMQSRDPCSKQEFDTAATCGIMQPAGQLPGEIGIRRTPSAPPIPWALLGGAATKKPIQKGKTNQLEVKQDWHFPEVTNGFFQEMGMEHANHFVDQNTRHKVKQDSCFPEVMDGFVQDVGGESATHWVDQNMGQKVNTLTISDDTFFPGEGITLMIKNIPYRMSQQDVLDVIKELGFADRTNFFYLPIRRGQKQHVGYAFCGFVDVASAKEFALAITGYRFPGRSRKTIVVAQARIQGFCSYLQHFHKMKRKQQRPLLSMAL